MCWKSPPTSDPAFTSTLPPIRIAETSSLRSAGFGSISFAISSRSMNEPCEWPMSTKPRPWLYLLRYVWNAFSTSLSGERELRPAVGCPR